MAVSFKVPASPKKDIFLIDQFLGVDLTNTGSNIDENRSPNAENMVRYVPGKVRKRMGYSVPVEFSKGTDVNRAVGSSNDLVTLEFDDNGFAYFPIYGDIDVVYFRFHWEVVGTYTIYLDNNNDTHWSWQDTGTEEEPLNETRATYGTNCAPYGGFKRVRIHHDSDGETDYCRVSQMFICCATNIERTNWWKSTDEWKPAPEDKGNVFIKTLNDAPIYGHHTLKTGKKEGDYVTDVNRARGTSSTYETFPDRIVCSLGETVPTGKKIYISFDYKNETGSPCYIRACGNPRPGYYMTGDEIVTIPTGEGTIKTEYTSYLNFSCISIESTAVEIKNMLICYAETEDVSWSTAPEDNGASFGVDNVYQPAGDNTAIFSSKNETQLFPPATRTEVNCPITIQQSTTAVVGKITRIDFEVAVSVEKSVSSVLTPVAISAYTVGVKFSDNTGATLFYADGQPNNNRYTMYVKPDDGLYVKDVVLDCVLAETTTQLLDVDISIKSATVYEVIEKEDFWSSAYINLFHVGTSLYVNKSGTNNYALIYNNMNTQRSVSWQFEARDNDSALLGYDNLYIVDGQTFIEYNGAKDSVSSVYGNGKIPLITVAKSPSGGGASLYPVNRLQPGFEESFIGDGTTTAYQLTFGNLDISPSVRVWIRDKDDGSWLEKEENVDFTVNYGMGIVQFSSAPWDARQQSGEDNVKVRAYRTIARYVDSINKCSFGTLFGVGGTSDRLFLSGNPDYPNYDYYSEMYDPTYFPDVYYGTLGVSSSAIKGYARVNNYLATFKDENEPSQSVFIREGDLVVNSETNVSEPAFKLINTLQGNGAISPYTFGYLQTEPLFLTKSGVFAITAQDITGEKYGQNRSFFLDGALLKENNLEEACAIVYNDQYILGINGHLYVLDGLQPVRTDAQMPYSTRQYVGFYCTQIPANVMWTYDDALWFGTLNGRVCKFHTDIESLDSYNDDGQAIYCCWETPDLDGKLFYKNKTFKYIAIRMMKALRTSVTLGYQRLGSWHKIKEDISSGVIFDFASINFENFSFSTDSSEKVSHAKIRVKKVDKARFRVENGNKNEPFGLFDFALEYIESGNFKG